MDVMWVVESGGLSGGVRVIFEYATRLAKRGHKVTIASLDYQPQWFDLAGTDWWVFPEYNSMMKRLKEVRARKVATWWRTAAFLKGGIEEGEGYYLVQDVESTYYFRPSDRTSAESTYELGYKMFTPNPWVTTRLDNVACVGQAYDSNVYKKSRYVYPEKNRVLAIMRRQALKGFSELGELSRRLAVIDKEISLVTFGVDNGTQLVGAHSGHRRAPPDNEIVKMYSEGSVFASTSQHEGFSLSPLEAMACGCPVATTDADGNYFCVDGQNCLKFNKKDMAGMASGIVEIMRDDVMREKLVAGGHETAKQFSNWEPVIDKLESFLS